MKKILVVSLLVAFVLAGAWAGGKSEQPAAGVAKKVTIKFGNESPYELGWVKAFAAKYPDIAIEPATVQLAEIDAGTLKVALAAGTGPDVFNIDSAPARMGLYAEAGVLLPLDKYYKDLKWDEKVFPWALKWVTYKDGKKFGIPMEIEIIGVMYNKKIFQKLGLSAPATQEEFQKVVAAVKNAGLIPIVQGTKTKAACGWLYAHLIEQTAGRDAVEKVLQGSASWNNPEFNQAAQIVIDWAKSGVIPKEANSIAYEEANAMFFDGKAAMTIVGSWLVGDLMAKPDLDMDYFIVPPFNKNVPGRYTGGLGGGLAISAATKYPDECAKFLDFVNFSEEGQRNFFEGGNRIPCVNADLSRFKLNPLFKKVIEATKDPKGIGFNLSVVTPANVKNAYYEVIQGLIGGLISPADANQTIQKEAEKARAGGK